MSAQRLRDAADVTRRSSDDYPPDVALALADWLDDTATSVASGATYSQDALRLADLILGGNE